ncbi:hypothetical protein CLIB1444_17S00342 [[Candida] jaroonii]|uniref:Uncharacterized protein n=1 Tax=[Candida] jaroonii TaxID=467808 RepID=A0ACA9YES0_9ASCO|nr:hypothetical protein CLIB1444_17S00342 [[Candida] jaroonii]
MSGKKRVRKNPINRNRCSICKHQNKRCDLKPGKDRCSYCEKKDLVCEIPQFRTILYQGPPKRKERSLSEIHKMAELIHKDQHPNLDLKESIILNYLGFSIQQSPDLKHVSTIRSNGFFAVYEKKVVISEFVDGHVLDEEITEIPLVDDNTNFEKKTGELYGIAINDAYKYFTAFPEYTETDFSNNLLELSFEHTKTGSVVKIEEELPLVGDIDTIELKNELFLEGPALVVDKYDFKDKTPTFRTIQGKFIDIPEYISSSQVEILLNNFCIHFPQETSKLLYATNPLETLRDHTSKVLTTYLTLAFSNVVVLKCILLWSAHCMELKGHPKFEFKHQLKNEIVVGFNSRMNYITSICCDHTLAIEYLLYDIQVLENEIKPEFWYNLNCLVIKSMSMRGGLQKLVESTNGQVFRKIFCLHYFTRFSYSILKYDISSLEIDDVQTIFNIPAVDNQSSYYNAFKDICAVVVESFHLYGLMKLARNSNHLNDVDPLQKYEALSSSNVTDILNRCDDLEKRMTNMVIPSNEEPMQIKGENMRHILEFMKLAASLIFHQLIYNYTSTSPFTLLRMKDAIRMLTKIFDIYVNDGDNAKIMIILPIFIVGCDISDPFYRNWFMENLDKLYSVKRHAKYMTMKRLIEKVWEINRDGNTWVSWPDIAEDNGWILPLYV